MSKEDNLFKRDSYFPEAMPTFGARKHQEINKHLKERDSVQS